ncbi:PQQ-binding-like beta-propeller repeat protein [Opitutus sp. ER46]|uniref:S8 family serine peptidase n=1 Tax=Opitutus sp. ER46 TaxID=2161864 RepID=UPI000D315E3E|nr:PQQ-binding-like beta-propeller repeat protein [Opitutus sp. ER46]PTX90942.1 hypothetical protein DB354_20035 [Opitutus sp. ER46]
MKATLSCFLVLALAAFGYGATTTPGTSPRFTAKELKQGFRDDVILARPKATHLAVADSEEAAEGVRVRTKLNRLGELRVIEVTAGEDPTVTIARLQATGRYEFVEPDYLRSLQATTPNDPRYTDGSLWGMNNNGDSNGVAGADIDAPLAWDIRHDAPDIIVAVVDTGVNLTHQDIAGNLWTNPSPTISDLHGANFVGGAGRAVSGDPTDDDGHGTHVAGTIGAVGNNAFGVTGVAWKVKLMAVKVFPAGAKGSISEIAAGVNYAISHGAHIINASYGGDASTTYSATELASITAARNAGIIFVAAAGNAGADMDVARFYPASFALDNIVTVGASNRRDEVSTFSNYGAAVDLYAPGEEILSLNYANNSGTATKSGTSMATPHVAGALALLKAQFPSDTYRQSINRLLRGAERGTRFASRSQTGARLNLYNALTTTSNLPFNDAFASRPSFTNTNLVIRSNNAGATAEANEPAHAGFAASATLWWEWKAPASGTVSVSTSGSAYDTVLALYTGTSVDALTAVASNDNDSSGTTSRITFSATAGTTYQIAVGGKSGATGLTLLSIGTIPANDAFASPVTLSGASTHVTATNANCSREVNEPRIVSNAGGTSLWYRWTAPQSRRYQIGAVSAEFDPILGVYTGSTLASLAAVATNDNLSSFGTAAVCTFTATAGTTYLIAVDSKSATTVGTFTLNITDSEWQAGAGDAITGSPAVADDGSVYFGSTDKSVYAYNADGSLKWTYATGGLIDTCSPAIGADGSVYIGSNDGKFYAFTATGSLKWSNTYSGPASSSPAIGADGTIYTRVADGFLYALDPATGNERWRYNVNATASGFYGNPVVGADGTIYQGSDDNDRYLYALKPTGSLKWRFATSSGVYGAPAIDAAGNVYFTTLYGRVYGVNASGTELWHVDSPGNISSSVALSPDGGTLYYADYNATLYARDTATGTVRWTYALEGEVRASSPAVDADGRIYIGAYDNKLYVLNPNGTLQRTYSTCGTVRSAPALANGRLYVGSNDQRFYVIDVGASPAAGPWPQYRHNARRTGRALVEAIAITAQPTAPTAVLGQPFSLSVTAVSQAALTYQWYKNGNAIAGATGSTYSVAAATSGDTGIYQVTIANGQTTVTSTSISISVEAPRPGRLTNLSILTKTGRGSQTLIAGFTISGTGSKPLLIRGIGPSVRPYPFLVTDAIGDPVLDVLTFPAGVAVAHNQVWGGGSALSAAFEKMGAFGLAADSLDSAALVDLSANSPGTFTMQVTSASGTNGSALAEIYDLESATVGTAAWLYNLSARAQVGGSAGVLTAGFAISGNMPKKLLIRGAGPQLVVNGSLSAAEALANPKLDIFRLGDSTPSYSNDDWDGSVALQEAFAKTYAFPLKTGSKDAALIVTLAPGTYTVQISGVNNTAGIALVEVYEVGE